MSDTEKKRKRRKAKSTIPQPKRQPLEFYGYEISFKLPRNTSDKGVNLVYREIQAFEKQLNRRLREDRNS
jgi:hypothetical protein